MPRGIDAPATVRAGWEQYREALDRLRDALKSNGHVATVGELHLAEHVTASLKKPLAAEVPLESTPQSALEAIEPAVEPARESRPAPRADMVFVQHATPPAPQGSAPSPDTAPRYADHLALDIAAPRQEPGAMPATGLSVALPQVAPEISVLVTSIADAAPAEQPHIVVQPSADLPVREEKQHEVEATQTAPVAVDVAPLPPPEKPVLQIQEPSPASRATADQPALKAPETAAPVASPAQPRKRERATKRGEAAAAPPQQRARPEPARENAEPEGEIIDLKLPLAAEPAARLQISGDAEDAVMDLKPPTPASPPKERTEPVVHAPKLSDEDVIDLKLPPSAPAPPPAALPSDEPEPTPVLPAVKPSNDSKSAELVRPTRQYRNGLERLRIGVKIDETQPPGSETAEGAQGAAEQPPPAQARATASSEARATGPVVKLGFDRKQPRRDFAPQNPKSANAATPKGVAPNGAKGAAPSADTSSAAALASALADYFGKLGRPQPPMHMTDREGYKKLLQTGHLEAPYRGRSTWSFSGMLAKGEVAIRLKPGADKFVELVPSIETFGQIPQFYPRGVGIGECRGTVPTEQLQYFDIPSRQWLAVKR